MNKRYAPVGYPELERGLAFKATHAAIYRMYSGTVCCFYGRTHKDALETGHDSGLVCAEDLVEVVLCEEV